MIIVITAVIGLFILGKKSTSGDSMGLVNGKLASCPKTPNCVCSEYADDVEHYIEPYRSDNTHIMSSIRTAIERMGGDIENISENFLSATFTSRLFRFVDDVEVRIDHEAELVHFRSASRVGRGDMGVNRKRIGQLKEILHEPE